MKVLLFICLVLWLSGYCLLYDRYMFFRVYLSSPKSSGYAEQFTTGQVAGVSLFSNADSETNSCLIVKTDQSDSIPKHALQAFKFLSASPQAQVIIDLLFPKNS